MSSFAIFIAVVTVLSGIHGVQIKQLVIPNVVRNGTGPVSLLCIYDLENDDAGLVVKWFHNENELIYQWIPPMRPQDIGVIHGRAQYPDEILRNPRSHSIIHLPEVTTEMGGKYMCSVSTFRSEAMKFGEMIVYAPENSVEFRTTEYNGSHISLVCDVQGAWPPPNFEYSVDGVAVEGQIVWPGELGYKEGGLLSRYRAIIKEPEFPVLIECEIIIPSTDYRRRKGMVYYPRSHRSTTDETPETTSPLFSASSSASPLNFENDAITEFIETTQSLKFINESTSEIIGSSSEPEEFLREEAAFQRNNSSTVNLCNVVIILVVFLQKQIHK